MSDAGSQGSGRGNGPPPARGRGLGGRRGGATGIVGGRGIPLVGGRGNQGLGRANPLGNHLVAGQGNQGVGRANPVVNGVGNVGPMGGGNGVFVGVGNIWAVGRGNGAAAVGNGVLGGVGNVEAAAVGNGGVAAVENGGAATVGNGGAAGRGNIGAVGRGNGGAGGRGRGRGFGRGALPNNNSIDALLASEARLLMPVLHPQRLNGALWFGTDNAPRQAIVAAIRRHFDGPWFNISSVPNETIIQWWGEFIQAFYWEPAYGAMVYNFWHNITAARLRGMVSTAKGNNQRPVWISLDIWNAMWAYWNTERAQNRSRIAAENRMSNRDGLGPHAHTSGARSFNQVRDLIRQREGAEPSMLRVLRETHRRPDGTYADGRAEYIDQEIQRQLEQSAQRQAEEAPLGSETASGTGGSALTQPNEDELFWQLVEPSQSGRVFGVGGQQPIRERGESSTMAASRVTLERQVQVLEQQLATVIQQMNRYLPSDGSEPNIPPTPRTQGAMGSGTGHVEPSTVNGDVAGEEEEDAAEGEEEEDPAEEDDGAFAAF